MVSNARVELAFIAESSTYYVLFAFFTSLKSECESNAQSSTTENFKNCFMGFVAITKRSCHKPIIKENVKHIMCIAFTPALIAIHSIKILSKTLELR